METSQDALALPQDPTRRDVLRWAGVGALGAAVGPAVLTTASGCNFTASQRSFVIKEAFRFEPQGALVDLAFSIAQPVSDYVLDYVDLDCPHCKLAFRIFLYALEFGASVAIACPGCTFEVRLGIAATRFLVGQLQSYGMSKALGLAVRGGYRVHKVGPARTRYGTLSVARSIACYSVHDREPSGHFNREIPALPDKINYFTDIRGGRRSFQIEHVWRRDGQITDRIPLDIGSSSWRTWSRKRNLAPGVWLLTTEMDGIVLDLKEFSIAA